MPPSLPLPTTKASFMPGAAGLSYQRVRRFVGVAMASKKAAATIGS